MVLRNRPFSWLYHILITILILSVVLLLTIYIPDIKNVFGVVGEWVTDSPVGPCLWPSSFGHALSLRFKTLWPEQIGLWLNLWEIYCKLHTQKPRFCLCLPGSTTSTCLLCVYPGLFYLRISDDPIKSPHGLGVRAQLLLLFSLSKEAHTCAFRLFKSIIS